MTELPPPGTETHHNSGVAQPKRGLPIMAVVMLVIGLVLAVVISLIFVGITVSQQFSSQSSEFTISDAAVAKAQNVIVLQAHDADGHILVGPAVNATHDLLTHRLDRAGIPHARVAFNDDRIYVIFDDTASRDSMKAAEQVLKGDYVLEVRRVTATTTCASPIGDGVEPEEGIALGGSAEGSIFVCDSVGDTGYTLGPVELSGTTITEATAVEGSPELANGQWFVNLTFDADGTRAFAEVTNKLVGELWPLNGIALVLDGEVLSAPQVMAAITDGKVQISGDFDQRGAESLAKELHLASQGLSFSVELTRTGE